MNWMLIIYQIHYNLEALEACFSQKPDLIYHWKTDTFQERKNLPFLYLNYTLNVGADDVNRMKSFLV